MHYIRGYNAQKYKDKIVEYDKINKLTAKVIDKVHRYSLVSKQDVYNVISNRKNKKRGGLE